MTGERLRAAVAGEVLAGAEAGQGLLAADRGRGARDLRLGGRYWVFWY